MPMNIYQKQKAKTNIMSTQNKINYTKQRKTETQHTKQQQTIKNTK